MSRDHTTSVNEETHTILFPSDSVVGARVVLLFKSGTKWLQEGSWTSVVVKGQFQHRGQEKATPRDGLR